METPEKYTLLTTLKLFPRVHLTISAVLTTLLGVLFLLPESGISRVTSSSQVIPLVLPAPSTTQPQASSQTQSDSDTSQQEEWQVITVKPGDTLARILQRNNVSAAEVHNMVSSDKAMDRLTRLKPGEEIRIAFNRVGLLSALQYQPTKTQTYTATRTREGWTLSLDEKQYIRQLRYAEADIHDSLFLAANNAGISDRLTMKLAGIFGWSIDFVLDIRKGDKFRILHEELYLDGEKVGDGDILAAEFWNDDRHFTAFRYQTRDGDYDYLDINGDSLRREFIRTPVAFSRISSKFSMNRKHPVLNKIRAHKGIDYAAPSGTPVKAAGDGKVIFAGNKGGYGKVVILQHGQSYTTLYAHLKGYARGVRTGARVKQGQTIAYVGSSGLATGPHLHYEFRVNGVHRNPLTVPLPKARSIDDSERKNFLVHAQKLKNQLALHADAYLIAQNDL